MINFIIEKFVPNSDNPQDPYVRESYGKLGSIVGIILNILLSISKILVGIIFSSVSITADGVNNLSDAGSSVVTFIGFKMSGKPADEDHPFGHARIEYLTGLALGIVIIYLGIELIKSSYSKIFEADNFIFSQSMIIVLLISIIVKIWLSYFNFKIGTIISSTTMKATAVDSRNDVIATSTVLISVIISKFTGYQIDGYMGVLVALFIIYSGVMILKDVINPLLGELPEKDFIKQIQTKILSYEGVLNIHDLVVHNYGPNKYFATVHVEVDAKEDILKSHDLIDKIERDFQNDLDINMVIHLDPIVSDDEHVNDLKIKTSNIVKMIDKNLSIHDFRIVKGETNTNLIFDIVVPQNFSMSNREILKFINKEIKKENENYFAVVTIDKNYTSTCVNKPNMK